MPGSKDLIEGMVGLDAHAEHYLRMWTYYAGDLPEGFATEAIRRQIEKTGEEYRIRLAKKPVDALANRCGIASIVSSRGAEINKRIESIRDGNDMDLQEPFIHKRLFTFGDAYVLVYPVGSEDDISGDDGDLTAAPPDAATVEAGVELAYQSPVSCRAFYDAEDGRRLRFVIRRWKESTALGDVWRAEVWYADRMEPWITKPAAKGTDADDWEQYAEDANGVRVPADGTNWPQPHDFGEVPIKHARTDLPYGTSMIEDFTGTQNLITKSVVTQGIGIESHGLKERYRIADDAAILDQGRDSVNWDDVADAPAAVDRKRATETARRTGPGYEQVYHGTKTVGEFSAPDLGGFIDPVEAWIRWGSVASDTPLYEFDPRTGAQMSGIARKRADLPMKAREKTAKKFIERFWREVYGLALSVVGVADPGEITVEWEPPQVEDDPEWWATATVRRDHGVPQRQILTEANYTTEQIDEWETKQDEGLLLDAQIDRLAKLGEALQALGSGATLLHIPEERIGALIDKLLNGAGVPGKTTFEQPKPPPMLPPGPPVPPGNVGPGDPAPQPPAPPPAPAGAK